MTTEAMSQGQALSRGKPKAIRSGTPTRPPAPVIKVMARNGSSLTFRKAFQPACSAAAASTAAKTLGDMVVGASIGLASGAALPRRATESHKFPHYSMIPKSGTGFRKRSCSSKQIERDDDSTRSHRALARDDGLQPPPRQRLRDRLRRLAVEDEGCGALGLDDSDRRQAPELRLVDEDVGPARDGKHARALLGRGAPVIGDLALKREAAGADEGDVDAEAVERGDDVEADRRLLG